MSVKIPVFDGKYNNFPDFIPSFGIAMEH